ncbi:MAG: flagellar hook-associated protein FlgK [Methylomonas sp.]|nr:flagellar hook-associated protein FlgK [Methylomonas sp.]PPD19984.1 MAG: flagellar hook-associated protein FlgK [Methylomonas sp.]PPD26514.1 MAG: flagellar hook-associated protein FlgK [Methylomonas sp.]PPD36948.1 MAG: flagellar hook-associated protein FlgK [Methylomonas sp.]PPD38282.1 MAG: flagellar hook-associated protein FlgK [Methylomonas sp.]
MAIGILNNALTGLAAFQRSLETTSNNIANVNTEGYSRQRVELRSMPEQYTGAGFIGSGVNTANVSRSYDQFVTAQLRSSISAHSDVATYHSMAAEIDNLFASQDTGLSNTMKSFFNSVNDVASAPSSMPVRNVMLAEARSMTAHFNIVGNRLEDMQQRVDSNISTVVEDLNQLASGIARLNVQITDDIRRTSGKQLPNALLDQRDVLLNKIAENVDVSVVEQNDGSLSVFIGRGQPLVMNSIAYPLSVQSSQLNPAQREIVYKDKAITGQLSGGKLAANLRFRDEVLNAAQSQLGTLVLGFATEFNNRHAAGVDLDGNAGNALFAFGTAQPQVTGSAADPALRLGVTFTPPPSSAPLATAYRITQTTPTHFELRNLNDNSMTSYPDLAALQAATPAHGFNFNVTAGSISVGDSFVIRPAMDVASKISVALTNPRQIAAADAAGLPGDNRNALRLANLENATLMQNGKSTFNQVYGQLVADVGGLTHAASISSNAQKVLLEQARTTRESLSGVNLDEEAANLIKFQNAYQAAAQAVSMANSLFETLIGVVR